MQLFRALLKVTIYDGTGPRLHHHMRPLTDPVSYVRVTQLSPLESLILSTCAISLSYINRYKVYIQIVINLNTESEIVRISVNTVKPAILGPSGYIQGISTFCETCWTQTEFNESPNISQFERKTSNHLLTSFPVLSFQRTVIFKIIHQVTTTESRDKHFSTKVLIQILILPCSSKIGTTDPFKTK